jgi:two-component system KDP operon response regulator KdpE
VARVLVVDDDRALLRALRVGLAGRGHEVSVAATGQDGLSKAAMDAPEVMVLDLGLPDLDGLEVLKRVRQWTELPVIVLSAQRDEERKVEALDGGADDYVTKPFGMAELEARIRTAVRHSRRRRTAGEEAPTLTVGPLELDLANHRSIMRGEPLELTAKEFDFLAYLARHPGQTLTHQMILHEVWGPGFGSEVQYLRVYAYRLRHKLGDPDGTFLRSAPGVGYLLAKS